MVEKHRKPKVPPRASAVPTDPPAKSRLPLSFFGYPIEIAFSASPTDSTRQMKDYERFRKISHSLEGTQEEQKREEDERAQREVEAYAMPMDELYKRSNQKLDVAKRGRPRIKNGEIDKVREKHEAKKAWKDIRDEMNKEFKQNRTEEAYRAMLRIKP